MTISAAATHLIPAALITHSVVLIKGQHHDHDISVHHARTPDARMSITLEGMQMVIYNCQAAQGLLEAFSAARSHMLHVPAQIPTVGLDPDNEPAGRVMLSIEWTRRPVYVVAAQSALNRLKTAEIHWVELYTGPLTWRIRDRAGLLSFIEILTRVHQTAITVFLDGEQYKADPTDPGYRAA
ncbi:hypothetical protein [Mycobacterium sp. 1465703.0]|uniref:hypothetical protein n=1 Tax=Mycobacterium sp. 1465703.0 TaxID=1834078 RepID=UPI0007FD9EAB|nr:hypothetical protein [Mycobacterium sp. 1465703.0]OBJ01003.1 hypothetical protein A5625_25900 [Mycobacterium sp. 1465703.0]